jgi:hypothetical protein
VACLFALVFEWKWLVPCVVLGILVGMFVLDPAVKGGTKDSQMDETCINVAVGTFVGLLVGLIADSMATHQPPVTDPELLASTRDPEP